MLLLNLRVCNFLIFMEGNKQTGVKFIEVYNKLYNEIEHLFVCVSIYTKKTMHYYVKF